MPSWVFWLLVVLIVGVGLVLFATLRDRHVQTTREELLTRPPARAVPGPGGQALPVYVPDAEAGRPPAGAPSTDLTAEDRRELERQLGPATHLGHGMAAPGFVTDDPSGRAVLDDPLVLLCAQPVTSLRTLLPFLERAAAGGHVVVAPDLDPVLLRTLEVNAQRRSRRLLAVTGVDARARDEIRIATGATPVEVADLQAGYLPPAVLGRCERWVSDRRQSWVVTTEPPDRQG